MNSYMPPNVPLKTPFPGTNALLSADAAKPSAAELIQQGAVVRIICTAPIHVVRSKELQHTTRRPECVTTFPMGTEVCPNPNHRIERAQSHPVPNLSLHCRDMGKNSFYHSIADRGRQAPQGILSELSEGKTVCSTFLMHSHPEFHHVLGDLTFKHWLLPPVNMKNLPTVPT